MEKFDEKTDLALTSDILDKVANLVGAINLALDCGLDVSVYCTTAKIQSGFRNEKRTSWLEIPPVTVVRKVQYT